MTNEELIKNIWAAAGLHSNELHEWRAELLCRLGAAVSASPQPLELALRKIADNYGGCHCDHTNADCCEKIGEFCPHCISEIALASASPVSSFPKLACPKCRVEMDLTFRRDSRNSQSMVRVRCQGKELSYHEFVLASLKDFVQFVAAAPDQEPDDEVIIGMFCPSILECADANKCLHDCHNKPHPVIVPTNFPARAQEQPVENSPQYGICGDCGADRSGPSAEAHDEGCPQKGKP